MQEYWSFNRLYFANGHEVQVALRFYRGFHACSTFGQCQFWKIRNCKLRVESPLLKDCSSAGSTNFLHLTKYSLLCQRDMKSLEPGSTWLKLFRDFYGAQTTSSELHAAHNSCSLQLSVEDSLPH